MDGLMRQISDVAAAEGASRVTRIRVWCGALSHFTADHFRDHFARASTGTVADDADVEVEVSDDVTHRDASAIRLLSVDVDS